MLYLALKTLWHLNHILPNQSSSMSIILIIFVIRTVTCIISVIILFIIIFLIWHLLACWSPRPLLAHWFLAFRVTTGSFLQLRCHSSSQPTTPKKVALSKWLSLEQLTQPNKKYDCKVIVKIGCHKHAMICSFLLLWRDQCTYGTALNVNMKFWF